MYSLRCLSRCLVDGRGVAKVYGKFHSFKRVRKHRRPWNVNNSEPWQETAGRISTSIIFRCMFSFLCRCTIIFRSVPTFLIIIKGFLSLMCITWRFKLIRRVLKFSRNVIACVSVGENDNEKNSLSMNIRE